MVIAMIGAGFTGPWVAAITVQLGRIEGWSVLVLTQFAMGTLLVLEFILFIMFWEVAAFRADRSDESIQMIQRFGLNPVHRPDLHRDHPGLRHRHGHPARQERHADPSALVGLLQHLGRPRVHPW